MCRITDPEVIAEMNETIDMISLADGSDTGKIDFIY